MAGERHLRIDYLAALQDPISGKRNNGAIPDGRYSDGRELSTGLKANAAYFKLDFLDPAEVNRGDKLNQSSRSCGCWPGAAARLRCRQVGKWLIPKASPFAVLLKEDEFGGFAKAIAQREDIEVRLPRHGLRRPLPPDD